MLNKMVSYCSLLIAALLLHISCFAQDAAVAETGMRSNGKIYVVATICITILVGLILYLVSIDRKISKIEKEN